MIFFVIQDKTDLSFPLLIVHFVKTFLMSNATRIKYKLKFYLILCDNEVRYIISNNLAMRIRHQCVLQRLFF